MTKFIDKYLSTIGIKQSFPTFLSRVVLILTLLLSGGSDVWGQTEVVVKVESQLNGKSELGNNYIEFNYFEEAAKFLLGSNYENNNDWNNAGKLTNNWYTRWYVRKKDDHTIQSLTGGDSQGSSWVGAIRKSGDNWEYQYNGIHFNNDIGFVSRK